MLRCFFLALALTFLSACGYHLGAQGKVSGYQTVSVPYVKGDVEGAFTTSLIEELTASGPLQFVSGDNGDITLDVRITGERSDNISFQFPKQIRGSDDHLVSSEKRLRLVVEGHLLDSTTGEDVIEPFYLIEGVDFDFLPIGSAVENAIEFSLGQLDSEEGARIYANRDVFRKLSRSIAYYIYSLQ